jgi:hypothetical protein
MTKIRMLTEKMIRIVLKGMKRATFASKEIRPDIFIKRGYKTRNPLKHARRMVSREV